MSVCGSCSAAQAVSNALSCLRRSWKARKFVLEATMSGGRLSWYGDCNNQNDADYTRCDGGILRCMIGTSTHTRPAAIHSQTGWPLPSRYPKHHNSAEIRCAGSSPRAVFAMVSIVSRCFVGIVLHGHGFGAVARLHATFKMSMHRGGIRTPRLSTSQAVAQTTTFTVSSC